MYVFIVVRRDQNYNTFHLNNVAFQWDNYIWSVPEADSELVSRIIISPGGGFELSASHRQES